MKLTEEGAVLAWHLARGFNAMREGVEALTDASANRPIQITMPPAFAVSWLLPRLPDFQTRHPDFTLMLNPTAELIEPVPGGIDLAIRYGSGNWPKMDVTPLLLPDMLVVGARELIGDREIANPSALLGMPWLQELGTNEVAEWMERHGLVADRAMKITHMPGNLIMDAVRRGDGLTYTARCFVDKDLQAGRLVELSCECTVGGYYIVTRAGVLRPPVKVFVKWLKQQSQLI
jgi:DNA-binding transcriptional LysR family regulator